MIFHHNYNWSVINTLELVPIYCPVSREDETERPKKSRTFSPDNFKRVRGANKAYCYKAKPIPEGTVWFSDCILYCLNQNAFIIRPNSKAQVSALAELLDLPGEGRDPVEGC